MIKLYEVDDWTASSKEMALHCVSYATGFNKDDFKCEVIQEPKRVGLFKKEDGIFHCWYEYEGMDAHKELRIVDAHLYVDTIQKKYLC